MAGDRKTDVSKLGGNTVRPNLGDIEAAVGTVAVGANVQNGDEDKRLKGPIVELCEHIEGFDRLDVDDAMNIARGIIDTLSLGQSSKNHLFAALVNSMKGLDVVDDDVTLLEEAINDMAINKLRVVIADALKKRKSRSESVGKPKPGLTKLGAGATTVAFVAPKVDPTPAIITPKTGATKSSPKARIESSNASRVEQKPNGYSDDFGKIIIDKARRAGWSDDELKSLEAFIGLGSDGERAKHSKVDSSYDTTVLPGQRLAAVVAIGKLLEMLETAVVPKNEPKRHRTRRANLKDLLERGETIRGAQRGVYITAESKAGGKGLTSGRLSIAKKEAMALRLEVLRAINRLLA